MVEGSDGSGKATQSGLLLERLKREGFDAVLVSFPRYDSFFGKLVKQYLKGAFGKKEDMPIELCALLYSIDRFEFKPELERMLSSGKIVVCNRYSESNFGHQTAKIESPKERERFLEWIVGVESRLPVPDLRFFLDMPVLASRKLMKSRKETDIHESDSDYLEKTRQVYLDIVKSGKNWVHVKCAEPVGNDWKIKSREEIHEIVWKHAREKL